MNRFPDIVRDEIKNILSKTMQIYPDVMQVAAKAFLGLSPNSPYAPSISGIMWVRYKTGSDPITIENRNRISNVYYIHKICKFPESGEYSDSGFSLGPWDTLLQMKNSLRFFVEDASLREYMESELTTQKFGRFTYNICINSNRSLKEYFTMYLTQLRIENDFMNFQDIFVVGESIHKHHDDFLLNYDIRILQS